MRWTAAWLTVCIVLLVAVLTDWWPLHLFATAVAVLMSVVGSVTIYQWCADRDRRRHMGVHTFPIPGGTITVYGRLSEAEAVALALALWAREMWDAR